MMIVYLGDYDARTHDIGEKKSGVSHYVNHPQYNAYNVDNDLSLIFLNWDIELSNTIKTACLANSNSNYENSQVIAAGWGIDQLGGSENILKEVNLITMNNQRCAFSLRNVGEVTDNMICATGNFKGTCNGDSGGPLMLNGSENTVIGVTSWGTPDCNLNAPSVFARVSSQLEWIKANAKGICID